MGVIVGTHMLVEVREQLREEVLSFYHEGPGRELRLLTFREDTLSSEPPLRPSLGF